MFKTRKLTENKRKACCVGMNVRQLLLGINAGAEGAADWGLCRI